GFFIDHRIRLPLGHGHAKAVAMHVGAAAGVAVFRRTGHYFVDGDATAGDDGLLALYVAARAVAVVPVDHGNDEAVGGRVLAGVERDVAPLSQRGCAGRTQADGVKRGGDVG